MSSPRRTVGFYIEKGLTAVTPAERERLLTDLLRGVSRAFYLTVRVLPRDLREPVGLAYLLARTADTIADTTLLPPGERLKHLLEFRRQIQEPATLKALSGISDSLTDKQSIARERELLASLPEAFSVLASLPEADRGLVRSIVVTLTKGMEQDLTTFPAEDSGEVKALKDWAALDSYTYLVAGCVGEFWTAMMMQHTPSLRHWEARNMSEIGVRFGKALQMTNVLRDVPKDLRIGRCYLPEIELGAIGLSPYDILEPSIGAKARPILVVGLEKTLEHYRAAEEYLLAIPRRHLRLRLAVLWPIIIGLGTLERLAGNDEWLSPDRPSKVSRGWVYRMMLLSLVCGRSNWLLRKWIGRLRRRVEQAL